MIVNNNIQSEHHARLFAFQSSLQSIDSVEILLDELKEQLAFSEALYSTIWVVLNEAVSNAVIHGNRFDPCKKVRLSVELKWDNFICFTIKDEGPGFDYENVPDPTSGEHIDKPNGRGVFLMKKLADLALFSDNGARVDLYFDLSKS